jgi:hypothetical protein
MFCPHSLETLGSCFRIPLGAWMNVRGFPVGECKRICRLSAVSFFYIYKELFRTASLILYFVLCYLDQLDIMSGFWVHKMRPLIHTYRPLLHFLFYYLLKCKSYEKNIAEEICQYSFFLAFFYETWNFLYRYLPSYRIVTFSCRLFGTFFRL